MSDGRIKDGTGKGYSARVCSHNRLAVNAVVIKIEAWKAQQGRTYSMNTGILPAAASKNLLFWSHYTAENKFLALERLIISWNGGNTNHNRCANVYLEVGLTQPDTGTEEQPIRNTNSAQASNTLAATALRWDGTTGTGMTGHTIGVATQEYIVDRGKTCWEVGGSFIIAPGYKLGIYIEGEEAGYAAIGTRFFELDPEEMV